MFAVSEGAPGVVVGFGAPVEEHAVNGTAAAYERAG